MIEIFTSTGRKAYGRFNISNFAIIDPDMPKDWSTAVIDLVDEVEKVKSVLVQEIPELPTTLEELKAYGAKIIISSNGNYHKPESLYALCDDSV